MARWHHPAVFPVRTRQPQPARRRRPGDRPAKLAVASGVPVRVLPARADGLPEIVAHRGASLDAPEHTLAAYEQAIADGADALECDVRLTADGHLVCVHDRRVHRVSDGRGPVSTQTLDELRRLAFTARRAGSAGPVVLDEERHRVLTLDGLLSLIVDAPRPVRLAVETKHPTRYAGYVEQAVVHALARYGLARPPRDGSSAVRLMSFSEVALRRLRLLAPGIPRVFLMLRVPIRFRAGELPYGARIAGPSIEVIRKHPHFVQRVQAQGNAVHVWTVDTPADLALCVELGVDAVITNRPRQLREELDRRRAPSANQGPNE
ncbi:MAG: glycerophosphodiester phosphodiesterase [Actinomycetota bacterium]|nr:MAG: glycerophosphodiester phosphodiesterase [Actinomycetota bacterium]